MKNLGLTLISLLIVMITFGQELPKDVKKVYEQAQKQQKKENYDQAVDLYKEVLRSVNHVPSMEAIGIIELEKRENPRYRIALEYFEMALTTLDQQIAAVDKPKAKKYLKEQKERIIPKRNKAASYVDDFDGVKDKRKDGKDLLKNE